MRRAITNRPLMHRTRMHRRQQTGRKKLMALLVTKLRQQTQINRAIKASAGTDKLFNQRRTIMAEHIKDFDSWCLEKKIIDSRDLHFCRTRNLVVFNWHQCRVESDGKHELFERPVLVVRKFNRRLFWGVPLTTSTKARPHIVNLSFRGRRDKVPKERRFVLQQMRSFDALRLNRRMGKLSQSHFDLIKTGLKDIIK